MGYNFYSKITVERPDDYTTIIKTQLPKSSDIDLLKKRIPQNKNEPFFRLMNITTELREVFKDGKFSHTEITTRTQAEKASSFLGMFASESTVREELEKASNELFTACKNIRRPNYDREDELPAIAVSEVVTVVRPSVRPPVTPVVFVAPVPSVRPIIAPIESDRRGEITAAASVSVPRPETPAPFMARTAQTARTITISPAVEPDRIDASSKTSVQESRQMQIRPSIEQQDEQQRVIATVPEVTVAKTVAKTQKQLDEEELAADTSSITEIKNTINDGYHNDIEGKVRSVFNATISCCGGDRAKSVFKHTLLEEPRVKDDLVAGNIARVDVWKYEYIFTDPITKTKKLLKSKNPISTLKKYWKNDSEARVIALTLYGNQSKYLDGLKDFLASIKHIKKLNGISDNTKWGHDTFTIRIYVAQRNPSNASAGDLKNATDPAFIRELLEAGCEIAYVDNHLSSVGRDATFWRFLVADEKMKDGQKIRYLLRDVDHKVTAAELFTVGEWINSGLDFHRMHLSPSYVGPLTASVFGGVHDGKNGIKEIKKKIEHFPYRLKYGDDEIFTKYVIWDHMKKKGKVLTHKYKRGNVQFFTNTYPGSSEDEPTEEYCRKAMLKIMPADRVDVSKCVDLYMPQGLQYPIIELGHDVPLNELKDEFFLMNTSNKRIGLAANALYEVSPSRTFLPSSALCEDVENESGVFSLASSMCSVRKFEKKEEKKEEKTADARPKKDRSSCSFWSWW